MSNKWEDKHSARGPLGQKTAQMQPVQEQELVQIGATSLDESRLGENCTLQEVQQAIQSLGLNPASVQQEGGGVFLAPLPPDWFELLERDGYLEEDVGVVMIHAEMP